MARKMSLWVTIAPFLCSFCIIGSGFALWQFNDVLETQATGVATVQVAAGAKEGKLSVIPNENFLEYRLILEQKNGEFSQEDEGIYFVPSIDLLYTDFYISENVIATLTGTMIISNNALSEYVEPKDYISYNQSTSTYTFFNQEIILNQLDSFSITICLNFVTNKEWNRKLLNNIVRWFMQLIMLLTMVIYADINIEFAIQFEEEKT